MEINNLKSRILNNLSPQYIPQNINHQHDASKYFSLSEYNQIRQMLIHNMLHNLTDNNFVNNFVDKHSNITLNKSLLLNELLLKKINNLKQEKNQLQQEEEEVQNIKSQYKLLKITPEMYNEMKNKNLHNNLPDNFKQALESNRDSIIIVKS